MITLGFIWCTAWAISCERYNNLEDHATDTITTAFFFGMRSCEFSKVLSVGSTYNLARQDKILFE